jgi:hypothetical protein
MWTRLINNEIMKNIERKKKRKKENTLERKGKIITERQ